MCNGSDVILQPIYIYYLIGNVVFFVTLTRRKIKIILERNLFSDILILANMIFYYDPEDGIRRTNKKLNFVRNLT